MTQPLKISVVGGGPGGLYFAILMKKADPRHAITVYERNRPDDTFGFGVVFSDETLDNIQNADPETFEAIARHFVYWGEIDIHVRGRDDPLGRPRLLRDGAQDAADAAAGSRARARRRAAIPDRCPDVDALPDSDLIVAADGINSGIRARYADHFKPSIDWRKNKFSWCGTTKSFPAFTFDFRENEHGIWILGAYQYKPRHEHAGAGMRRGDLAARRPRQGRRGANRRLTCERTFADLLDGHPVLTNRSIWRNFPMIKNERWYHDNIVLIGDALHTAHYSIGSGTKLAMEDSIALANSFAAKANVPEALKHYETDAARGGREDPARGGCQPGLVRDSRAASGSSSRCSSPSRCSRAPSRSPTRT